MIWNRNSISQTLNIRYHTALACAHSIIYNVCHIIDVLCKYNESDNMKILSTHLPEIDSKTSIKYYKLFIYI